MVETLKNENLLIAACHFWSNGANSFLFGHGPMSPTLADVYMITGLEVIGSVYPHKYKGSSRQTRVKTGVGYKRYIQKYMCDGPLSEVEYRAFLNMLLTQNMHLAPSTQQAEQAGFTRERITGRASHFSLKINKRQSS
jgi:hypothetical protein